MSAPPPGGFWQRLQQIPRACIYLLLAGVVVWQILAPVRLPVASSAATQGISDAIHAVPRDKLVILSADWDASTEAETGPQTTAVMHAILREKKRFAILNLVSPAGVKLAGDRAQEVAKQYGAQYGVDWCNWGYKYGYENVVIGLGKNIPATIKSDAGGKPMAALPMMAGVRDIHDVGLVIEITGSQITEYWLEFIQGTYGIPLANGVTAVMAPSYYPYLDSGQLKGMMVGAKGAAEMENLAGRPGQATRIMYVQSWAHLLILLLIVAGNLGYFLSRREGRRA